MTLSTVHNCACVLAACRNTYLKVQSYESRVSSCFEQNVRMRICRTNEIVQDFIPALLRFSYPFLFLPLFVCLFVSKTKLSIYNFKFFTPIGRSLYEHRGDYFSVCVIDNNEIIRTCAIFSQLLKIFPSHEDERLQTNALGLVHAFPTSATPLTMALKQFIPRQTPRYHDRKNKEFFTIEMPTRRCFMAVLTNTIFDSHWVLEPFSK